jgi:hypothetical protein
LKRKHPGENLTPIAAIIDYLVINGGIPHNLTLPEIKNLIGDDFLYEEITGDAAANTNINDDDYVDIEGSDSETTDVSFMGEIMNNQREPINDQPTAESSIDNPVPGNSRPFKVVTCTIEKKTEKKRRWIS